MTDRIVDEQLLPFTEEELIRAGVLMGADERDAKRTWGEIAAHVRRIRRSLEATQEESGNNLGIGLMSSNDYLMALSLLSDGLAERVRAFKYPWLQRRLDLQSGIDPRLTEEQARWERDREALRTRLRNDGRLP